jgi:tetratricopeptide (TPR) repeat protein
MKNKMDKNGVKRLLLSGSAVALFYIVGCATVQVEQDFQAGRSALLAGRPEEAVNHFKRAAESNPNFKTSYKLRESVWTYLGRAYYETGKYPEARAALDKALASDKDDYMARLYLGMTFVRSNDRNRGVVEMETALNGIHDWLENLTPDDSGRGDFDSGKQIRRTIETELAGKPSPIELVVVSQRIGKRLEEEIDRTQQEKGRVLD